MIIVPKLVAYLARGHASLGEALLRFHYLFSLAAVNLGLLVILAIPFTQRVQTLWLPLTAVPYFLLYLRELTLLGYRAATSCASTP